MKTVYFIHELLFKHLASETILENSSVYLLVLSKLFVLPLPNNKEYFGPDWNFKNGKIQCLINEISFY